MEQYRQRPLYEWLPKHHVTPQVTTEGSSRSYQCQHFFLQSTASNASLNMAMIAAHTHTKNLFSHFGCTHPLSGVGSELIHDDSSCSTSQYATTKGIFSLQVFVHFKSWLSYSITPMQVWVIHCIHSSIGLFNSSYLYYMFHSMTA